MVQRNQKTPPNAPPAPPNAPPRYAQKSGKIGPNAGAVQGRRRSFNANGPRNKAGNAL
jgi:hypothetical protein